MAPQVTKRPPLANDARLLTQVVATDTIHHDVDASFPGNVSHLSGEIRVAIIARYRRAVKGCIKIYA
jgi:hypothetical protein